MYPAYRWGGSYPYHANPMHNVPNDDPRAKEISSHMKMDPSTMSPPYEPWPYGGNYCYPGPQECHGGYNHGYFGGPYSFRPPYPYYPPPPSYHTHGFYPPFPGAYPGYSFPPPHYSVEQPKYDYDKNTHGSYHCCGCNHGEDEKKMKIEREKPEIDKKTSDSLSPLLLKDYPYPIMWVPPSFMNTESKAKEKERHSHDRVPLEPLEPSKQSGNGKTDRDQHGGDDNPLPFPIFWFPSKNNEVGEKNVAVANEASPFSRSEAESDMGSKPTVQKVIPVKQLGTEEEKKSLKSIDTKVKSGSVEKTDNGMEGKASPKTSKLPPVCLRIDPLPRKKNSSRSPSPPGDKGRSKGSPIDESKSSQQQTQLSEGLKKSKEEKSEGNIKTIKVVERESLADPTENVPRGAGSLADPCDNVPRGEGNGSEKGIVCKAEKKFSENEAALIIQSACRGFQVRKSKPITKLRQIAEVGKQVIELRERVQELESSSAGICFDGKQKLVIAETIMSLLLKLDTIQGLHPVVREVRKGVAKELVGLQEKLDSLTTSETPIEDSIKRQDDVDMEDEKSETQIENSMKREGDDDVEEKSGTQSDSNVKHVECCDDDDADLEPQMEVQNGESYNGDGNNKHVETKQPVESRNTIELHSYSGESKQHVDDDDVIQDKVRNGENMEQKVVESGTSIESVKDQVEMLEENEAEQDSVTVDDDGDDDVKTMEEVVKEQMDVIRELTARVKDLENKLLKNKKMNKVNKKRKRSRGCLVQEDL
ncbi:BAG family molecular chaperone regulator 6 isoform X3 [Cynara cardunculus var. scolymus]|uniref:BAG family molecular chaperone regulator 6 isoform X2 n=1 Tax=Cynara cardunculus var. scolymus TaxID=59895 RepID=UPI000D624972|nr:BAG family molecular chaperone regulator 6 isoform X2 [Cynara cardunculus var. scolymus]XP_024996862.1 BAG family molecular chaperone regulator 6 isoform X3 [Cynara cardunculus var. scolymus]